MAFFKVIRGVASMSNQNDVAQINKALATIALATTSFDLEANALAVSKTDNRNLFIATIDPNNQRNPVPAQVAQETKSLHASQAEAQSSIMNSVIQGQKAQSELLGQSIGEVFALMQPVMDFMKYVLKLLRQVP
jgi:hypothetical protein